MRIVGVGHAVFAATMIALGVVGFVQGDFAAIWPPVLKAWPARDVLVYACSVVSLCCGVGLLWQRTALMAARVLFAWLALWLLVFRLPLIVRSPTSQDAWSGSGETAVVVAAAWVLYVWFANGWEKQRLGAVAGTTGLRAARLLYAVALVIFGLAHFRFLKETASLVPTWLPMPLAWAALTGAAYVAAGLSLSTGWWARWAALLCTWQMGLFTLLVWVPTWFAGANAFQRSETVISWTLTAGAWVLADAYSGAGPVAWWRRQAGPHDTGL